MLVKTSNPLTTNPLALFGHDIYREISVIYRETRHHFQQSAKHSMHVIQVERIDIGDFRKAKPLWLTWVGEQMPPLSSIWHQYLRRFAVDHWYRFLKQRLHWTLPHFSTPEQSESWSDLMPLLLWQLWLARGSIQDCPLPWQQPSQTLSPGRVANSFATVLAVVRKRVNSIH